MSYMALYRKWRPNQFDEVKGQEHIVTTLKNQITHERIGHAYLFCGTRGTGKTTVAKLFAKAVNCEHPINGSPCGECASCKAIAEGSSMNVIEIDAASNNGVDNIRQIRDEVQYSPTDGKYRVYIIDEVHMLSIGAFNALLKTLEEPPAYVIFILATTEAHKLPITILSRCQRYDFRRISVDVISERLKDLMRREETEVEEKAIRYIAKVADGSMRDALSLLDQCIAFYLGETLTYEKALEVLGAVDVEVFHKLLTAVEEQKVLEAVNIIDDVIWQGRELSQFVNDFTWYMRNLLLIKSADDVANRLDYSQETIEGFQKTAEKISIDSLLRYIRIFSEVSSNIKYASQKRVLLEVAVIKLCKPEMERNYDSIIQQLSNLTQRLDVVEAMPLAKGTGAVQEEATRENAKEQESSKEKVAKLRSELSPAQFEELQEIAKRKNEAIAKIPDGFLRNRVIGLPILASRERDCLLLKLESRIKGQFVEEETKELLETAFSEEFQRQIHFEIIDENREVEAGFNVDLALLEKELGVPLEIEDK